MTMMEQTYECRDCGTSVTSVRSRGRPRMTCAACVKKRANECSRQYQARKREERKKEKVEVAYVQGRVE